MAATRRADATVPPRPRAGRDRCRSPLRVRPGARASPARSGARASATRRPTGRSSPTRRSGPASPRSRSRRRGPTCGSARRRTATSWRPAATPAVASSTATTRAGGRSATPTSSASWPSSAQVLPDVRKAVDADLRRRGLPREKVLALVVKLLDETLIRIGNESYAAENESYGLTTLKPDHVEVVGRRAAVRLHRQERPRARGVPRGPAAGPHRAPVPRARRPGPLRLPGRAARSPT